MNRKSLVQKGKKHYTVLCGQARRFFAAFPGALVLLGARGALAAGGAETDALSAQIMNLKTAAGILAVLLMFALLAIGVLVRKQRESEPARGESPSDAHPAQTRQTEKTQPRKEQSDEQELATRRIIDEISQSVLPQPLKNNAASATFSLAGGVQRGRRENCAFYDHFFVDEKTLCTVVAQVPGGGIAEALFAVVAQTTIRSRLRMGRSLIETMSDVNAQLYDLGSGNEVCALVGVLNVVSGNFVFVNAGGALPFLLRSEGSYDQLRIPVYAPLGANENVNYRAEKLRLNQGDRLFLYTEDLCEMTNDSGVRFGEGELLSALNRSREKARSTEEMVRFMEDESAAYCANGESVLCYAALSLEYLKGSRDYIFTTVPGSSEYASAVTEFMRKALDDAGVAPKAKAKQILLTDEMFTLCCRCCDEQSEIKVECAIRTGENVVSVRMFAPMGGNNPFEKDDGESGGSAADYIRAHTLRAEFQAGIDRDMVEIASAIS
ncbi:MAG: serine/threonine-protein phosphatase [Oscillospiraceae bacterium]|nr:serine/threonine-protein phosphatase [Oscillospiraceae bacterium]